MLEIRSSMSIATIMCHISPVQPGWCVCDFVLSVCYGDESLFLVPSEEGDVRKLLKYL